MWLTTKFSELPINIIMQVPAILGLPDSTSHGDDIFTRKNNFTILKHFYFTILLQEFSQVDIKHNIVQIVKNGYC